MGLDITAYSHLRHLGQHADGQWCQHEDHIQAFAYADFLASFRDIPILDREHPFVYGGCYEETPETETLGFHAGSYGGYNRWRDHLREQFNPRTLPTRPFYELIWFADNEGCIGPQAAGDLFMDFQGYRALYVSPSWIVGYPDPIDDWGRAFELASHDGLIRFH
jgi:hypothetical protein